MRNKPYQPIRVPHIRDTERFRADYEARLNVHMREAHSLIPEAKENLMRVKQACDTISCTYGGSSTVRICTEDLSVTVSTKVPILVWGDASFEELERVKGCVESIIAIPRNASIEVICYVRYFQDKKPPRIRALEDAVLAQSTPSK